MSEVIVFWSLQSIAHSRLLHLHSDLKMQCNFTWKLTDLGEEMRKNRITKHIEKSRQDLDAENVANEATDLFSEQHSG